MNTIKVGARIANYKILAVLGDDRFRVRCRCGNTKEVSSELLYMAIYRRQRSCMKCRARVYRVKTSCSDCGRALLRSTNNTKPKCKPCSKRVHIIACARSKKRAREKVTGRICIGCTRTDIQVGGWSNKRDLCGPCHRMSSRNGKAPCGAPLSHGGVIGAPLRCRRHGEADCGPPS